MAKMKFHVFGGGDRSVGINETESTIEIDDNYYWDSGMIQQFKEMIAEFYDNGKVRVLTDEELQKENEEEEKWMKERMEVE